MSIARELDLFTSFTGGILARVLQTDLPELDVTAYPLDDITSGTAPAVIWCHAEAASPAYAATRAGAPADIEAALADIRTLAARIRDMAATRPLTLVASLTSALPGRGSGALGFDPANGDAYLLARMNIALAEALTGTDPAAPLIRMLDASPWLAAAGQGAHVPKQWYVAKIPFAQPVFHRAAQDMTAALTALAGGSRKILITDLDDTLWGGVIGDDGLEGIRLGGHDHVGEIHADIQHILKGFTRRGIQLAIASKNDETTALAAIKDHPEMILTRDDFAGWAINWSDKADNIRTLMDDLRLGLDAALFLDDNPVERDRVRQTLPQVLVPDLPADKSQWPALLRNLTCFEQITLSAEDRARTRAYADERARSDARPDSGSREDWIASLEINVTARPLAPVDTQRTVQLFNKTNQMNLTTRRMTQPQLEDWLAQGHRELWTFRVADRFGDAGLTGILTIDHTGKTSVITDFVMSCRVIGRQVENTILALAARRAQAAGSDSLEAQLQPTDRNNPCTEFFRTQSGMIEASPNCFTWDLAMPYPAPASVTLDAKAQEKQAETTRGIPA